jgi:hypothetical protein
MAALAGWLGVQAVNNGARVSSKHTSPRNTLIAKELRGDGSHSSVIIALVNTLLLLLNV